MLKRWIRVVYAITAEEREEKWKQFKERYEEPIFEPLLEYLQSEWLDDCPEYFLHEYTSEYLHLNEISTSRTEGAHWLLKQDLQVSTNDLLVVLRTFENAVKLQFQKVTAKIENEKYEVEKKSFKPELFHQHWYLYSVSTPPIDPLLLLQDPLQVRRRGRPQGARNFISGEGT
ncbi:hypothetical protein N7508_001417 [Penicillium antarcticum]|uniref:uncharacterized protein n=1 Tax=Penicillium antarcticum TaxID=416450 RepID=UPI002391A843|nr:uncharacterized protein N7508_001417 [Penicillium antarcticum]KAJ5316909.1 hypothetical protein N7508_001417 [Penicillium antarcticum]